MITANISDILPLQCGHFIAVLRPYKKNESPDILLGEGMVRTHSVLLHTHCIGFVVVAMYTNSGARGSKHEPINSVSKVGIPSYVMVQVFCPSHGSAHSSLAFQPLQAATFIHIPASHILFSFAGLSLTFSHISLASDCAHPFQLVTLCSMASTVMANLCEKAVLVSKCVRAQMSEEQG